MKKIKPVRFTPAQAADVAKRALEAEQDGYQRGYKVAFESTNASAVAHAIKLNAELQKLAITLAQIIGGNTPTGRGSGDYNYRWEPVSGKEKPSG